MVFRLARLHFLVLGFLLYLLGYVLALQESGQHDGLLKFLFGYFVFGTAHLSVSFSNDYFDRQSDKKSCKTPFSGGSKVLVNHPELENFALTFAVFLLIISAFTSIIFTVTYAYSLWFIIFVLAGGLLGYFYTANPVKLSYRGFGEISTMFGVGLFMTGMGYYVAQGQLDWLFFLFIIPLSFYGLFFIITVQLPDMECDILALKKTLVVKFGLKIAKTISFLSTLTGTSYFVLMFYLKLAGKMFDWTPLIFFSFIPLLASTLSVLWNSSKRTTLIKQVMLNMVCLTAFVILTIIYLMVNQNLI